jgi:hypothetical protein
MKMNGSGSEENKHYNYEEDDTVPYDPFNDPRYRQTTITQIWASKVSYKLRVIDVIFE